MINTNDFKKNSKLMVDGNPYTVIDFQHVKPGKGNQFTRVKLKNLLTGQNLERTFKSGEKFEIPDISNSDVKFLYKDDNGFNFMDQNNFEQLTMNAEAVGEAANFLIEDLDCNIMFYNGRAVGVDVPNAVNIKVAHTEPGIKGDRVSGATKAARLETGYIVQVPLHIGEGDVLRIDTRTGDYVERVNK